MVCAVEHACRYWPRGAQEIDKAPESWVRLSHKCRGGSGTEVDCCNSPTYRKLYTIFRRHLLRDLLQENHTGTTEPMQLSKPEQRVVVKHIWNTSFANYAQAPTIMMKKNSQSVPLPFTLQDVVSLKPWMKAWKVQSFDELLQFNTKTLARDNQDLYREMTSYTWAELNDATRDLIEHRYGFIGNEQVSGDGGQQVPTRRSDLARQRLADNIQKKALEIVCKQAFVDFFLSEAFAIKCVDWKKRVDDINKAKNVPPAVVVGIPAVTPTHAATVAMAAATAASSLASNAGYAASVTVAVASVSTTPVPPPPPFVHELTDDEPEPEPVVVPVAEPVVEPEPVVVPVAAEPVVETEPEPVVVPVAAEPVVDAPIEPIDAVMSEDTLKRHFKTTTVWSAEHVGPQKLQATRITIHGFEFYSKFRATALAKTNGKRDVYCTIVKDSRAHRWCRLAGLPHQKKSDLTLRSYKDIARFWAKIVASGIDTSKIE